MKTIDTIANELIQRGIAIGAAYQQAAQEFTTQVEQHHQAEAQKTIDDTRRKDEVAQHIVRFLDGRIRLRGLVGNMTSPSQSPRCLALDAGIVGEPANYSDTTRAYFPPKLWCFAVEKTPWFLNQAECNQLLACEAAEPGVILKTLEAIGSDAAIAEYKAEWKTKNDAGLIKAYEKDIIKAKAIKKTK